MNRFQHSSLTKYATNIFNTFFIFNTTDIFNMFNHLLNLLSLFIKKSQINFIDMLKFNFTDIAQFGIYNYSMKDRRCPYVLYPRVLLHCKYFRFIYTQRILLNSFLLWALLLMSIQRLTFSLFSSGS